MIEAQTAEVRCVADVHAVLGEGPVWVEREAALYWLDIKSRKNIRLANNGEFSQWDTPMRDGTSSRSGNCHTTS